MNYCLLRSPSTLNTQCSTLEEHKWSALSGFSLDVFSDLFNGRPKRSCQNHIKGLSVYSVMKKFYKFRIDCRLQYQKLNYSNVDVARDIGTHVINFVSSWANCYTSSGRLAHCRRAVRIIGSHYRSIQKERWCAGHSGRCQFMKSLLPESAYLWKIRAAEFSGVEIPCRICFMRDHSVVGFRKFAVKKKYKRV
jgi:hypothetical protein